MTIKEFLFLFIISTIGCGILYKLGSINHRNFMIWEKVDATITDIRRCGKRSKMSIVRYIYNDIEYSDIHLYAYGFGYKRGVTIEVAIDPEDSTHVISSVSGDLRYVAIAVYILCVIIVPLAKWKGMI